MNHKNIKCGILGILIKTRHHSTQEDKTQDHQKSETSLDLIMFQDSLNHTI